MITWFSAGKVSLYPFMALRPRITEILLQLKFWNKNLFLWLQKKKKQKERKWVRLYMISLFVVTMLLSKLSLLSAAKGAGADTTADWWRLHLRWLTRKDTGQDSKKNLEQERSPHVYQLLRKSMLFEESDELRQVLLSLTTENVEGPRIGN